MSEKKSISGGIGFPGALFITFLVLKLTEVIDWSWWWVTAPMWIPLGICAALLLFAGTMFGIAKVLEARCK